MGSYKVIQDIEAEDKLLGPLSLRQFVYAIIVVVSMFMAFKLLTAPGPAKYFVVLLIPHTVFFAVLAAPFGHDQSSEVWLLAKIRFFFKPRKRIWDQTGMIELVTITVPKKIEKHLTKDFSQDEAKNRLKALANTLDSRGWAVKNVNANMFNQPAYSFTPTSDRLIDASTLPREVPIEEVSSTFDILDDQYNPRAQQMGQLINTVEEQHRQQLTNMMQQTPTQQSNQTNSVVSDDTKWFANEPAADEPTATTAATVANIAPQPKEQPQAASPMTQPTDPAIINLALNDDLNVSTIAREADKTVEQSNSDEVVISLH